MTIWIDAQVSPDIAGWIIEQFQLSAEAVRDAGLRDSEDVDIFNAARAANSVVLTKDKDFVIFLNRFGPPPKIILLRCGNTSNKRLKEILLASLAEAVKLLESGEDLIEINSPS